MSKTEYDVYGTDVTLSRGELYRHYWHDQLSMKQIAERVGVSSQTVSRAMDDLGVPKRTREQITRLNKQRFEKSLKDSRPYTREEYLKTEFVENNRSVEELASEHDVHRSTICNNLEKYGFREPENHYYDIPSYDIPEPPHCYAGYPVWRGCDGNTIPVHSLAAIAGGADPHDVFADESKNIDHINHHPFDNRPSNLRVMDRAEHGRKTVEMMRGLAKGSDSDSEFDRSDVESIIQMILNPGPLLELEDSV